MGHSVASKRLIGGPFDGAEVPRSTDSILLSGEDVPEGMVARYRFTAGGDDYTFDGYDKIVATIPRPGSTPPEPLVGADDEHTPRGQR